MVRPPGAARGASFGALSWLRLAERLLNDLGYLPRALAVLGIFGTAVLIPMSAVMFVYPQYIGVLKMVGLPGFAAEVATALWLLVKGLRPGAGRDREGGFL